MHMVPGMDLHKEFVLRTLEERDIRFVRLWFTDVLGFLKSVAIAPAELEGAFEEGIGFEGSRGYRNPTAWRARTRRPSRSCPGPRVAASTTRRGCSVTSPCPTVRRPGRTRDMCFVGSWPRPAVSGSSATCTPKSNSSC